MTPKEKALELVNELHEIILDSDGLSKKVLAYEKAKECALIVVKEALRSTFHAKGEIYEFYLEVRKEIKNL